MQFLIETGRAAEKKAADLMFPIFLGRAIH
jgi:hypothetical protein